MNAQHDTVIRVENLQKRYADVTTVNGLSFTIERGETFALLGPNGAGKSTTIEILEGYRTRSGGTVSVLGCDPEQAGLDWRSRLGIVLQSTGETGGATVREQLRHFAGMYPNPRNVDEVIAAVGLEAKAGTQIRHLSGGQRRRVDVALGIIGRPEVLFLDEPTTGFDPSARRQFWDLIRSLKDEGTTTLLTTHYLDEAAHLSDRVAVIAAGKLAALDTVDRLGSDEARTPLVRWCEGDAVREQRTHEPGQLVASLVSAAGGREPQGLEVIRPSLEDIYLGLIAEHDSAAAAAAQEA